MTSEESELDTVCTFGTFTTVPALPTPQGVSWNVAEPSGSTHRYTAACAASGMQISTARQYKGNFIVIPIIFAETGEIRRFLGKIPQCTSS